MSLYAHPHVRGSGSYFGYAYTYQEIERHMRNFSYGGEKLQLDLNAPKSKIQMYYGSPPGFYYDHQYKIQMTQWESTMAPPAWANDAKRYNEFWTANPFGAQALINCGVDESKVHVYEHGVDSSIWTPSKRGTRDVIRFLHIDSGSPRKRAGFAVDAFKAAFGNSLDYELTLKYSHTAQSTQNWFDEEVLATAGEWQDANVRHIRENMTLEELVNLYKFHDVLIYPSEGEGFGLIPLQALATGMPVISTGRWCSYEKYLHENVIESTLGVSPIVENYTRYGEVVLPNFDSTVALMLETAENIKQQADLFYNQVQAVTTEYNWQNLTDDALNRLVSRVGRNMFNSSKDHLR